MINLLIVEDQKTILELLKNFLEQESDLRIVGIASDGQAAIAQVERLKPDVVLMDVEMPGINGIEATKTISARYPEIKVLILTTHDDDRVLNYALEAGAKGYLLKNTPPKELINFIRSVYPKHLQFNSSLVNKLPLKENSEVSLIRPNNPKVFSQKIFKSPYFLRGIALNCFVWLVAIAYWRFAPPQYTSEWGFKILTKGTGVELNLPNIGNASSGNGSGKSSEDIRVDYTYIASDSELLEQTATQLGMTRKELGKPEIVADEEGNIISLSIEGDTPTEAQQKAYAFHHVVTEKIKNLRQAEIRRQRQHTQATLDAARKKLDLAQEKLAKYQVSSTPSSKEQIKQLTSNLEELYRQKAELSAQEKGLNNFTQQLGNELNLSSTEATAAYKLLDDDVFQQQLQQYAQGQRELTNLLSRFTAANPSVIEKQSELAEITAELQQRAGFLLNRAVSQQELERISYLTLDPKVKTVRQEIFKDLISNQAESRRLEAQIQELENQMGVLESRQKNVTQNQLKMNSFQRDLQVAEAVFATTLAELDLGEEFVYSLYPPIQLIKEPSLPKENNPTSPSLRLMMLGGMAGSFLVTTGSILLWLERRPSSYTTVFNSADKLPLLDVDRVPANQNSKQHSTLNSKSDNYN